MPTLNDQLLAAHSQGDHAALVTLYTLAADQCRDVDTACFYLTHAYVFALEINDKTTAALHARLKAHGRV